MAELVKRKLKPIPEFKNEQEEKEFWETHDSTDYVDMSKAVSVSPIPLSRRRERFNKRRG